MSHSQPSPLLSADSGEINIVNATNELIKQELWIGSIPIQFNISESDICSGPSPDPIYLMCSRMSFLPIAAADAVEFLRISAIALSLEDVWFEANGFPLKCNIPIGVLYDIYTDSSLATSSVPFTAATSSAVNATHSPWVITLRFQGFPADKLLRCTTPEKCERYFLHSLKQALYLLHGSTRLFNSLSAESQSMMWEGANRGVRDMYEKAIFNLKPREQKDCRLLPVRVLEVDHQLRIVNILQRPIPVCKPNGGSDLLLKDVLTIHFPNHHHDDDSSTSIKKLFSVIISGIEVPLIAPIFPLWSLFSHPDLFLYIVCIKRTSTSTS